MQQSLNRAAVIFDLRETRAYVRRCSSEGRREVTAKAVTEILRKDWYCQEEGNESAVWDLVAEASEGWQEDVGRETEKESETCWHR